jgi:hypothetical protein
MGDNRPDDIAASHGPLGAETDFGRPKRTPPTIDLDASEVTSETAPAVPSDTPEPVIDMESEPEAVVAANSEPEPEPAAEPPQVAPPRAPSRLPATLLGAVSGAIAAVLVVVAAAYVDWPGSDVAEPAPAASTVALDALDALAARVAMVEARPAPAAGLAPAAPDPALAGRIDALEKSVTALRGDLAAAKTQSERAATAVSDLKAAPRVAAAPPVDLAPINDRLGQIERASAALKTALAQEAAKPADDKPLRAAVAAALLESTVRQGEPYAAQLAAAKPLAPNAGALAPLQNFADAGLPTAAALSRDLLTLLPKLTPAAAPATTGTGLVDRLQAGAVSLLHIERTDAQPGDDRAAIVSRARAAAQRSDIAAARRELATLPAADRGPVQAWIDKVDARDAALAASRSFAADAMAALGKPAP